MPAGRGRTLTPGAVPYRGVGLSRCEAVRKRYGRERWILNDVGMEVTAGVAITHAVTPRRH